MQEDDEVVKFDCSSPLSKGGLNQIFICSEEGCDSRFSKRSYLEQHMCIHTNERLFVCSNDGCLKSYKRKDHLNRHMRSCPSSERTKLYHFPAKDCERESTTGDHLRKTNRDSHTTKKKTFTCRFAGCSQTFKKHQDLKSHKFDHTQKNPFQCPHPGCEMSFRWMNRLKRHTKIHDGYSCTECEQTFEKWTLLLKHKSSAHKLELACPVCSKTFPKQHRLNVHMKVHSEERVVYECPREGCVRYYSEKRNLDAHIRSYHDGSRFPCTHESCTRTFAFKHKMLDHLKSHSLIRKIKKKFPQKGHRRRNVVSLLTGLKCKNEAGAKESSDNDDLLLSNETKSFSTTPSCDWGGYSEILNVEDNTGDRREENSPLKAIEIPDENSDHGDLDYHLSEDLVPETVIDVELYKDKCVSNSNCREVPDSSLPKIGNDALGAKSQTNSIDLLEVTIDSSDNCSLTNSKQEPTKSPQIHKDRFTSTSSGSHLQISQTPKLSSVTLTGLRNNEIKISDQSLKFIADDKPMSAKDDSMNELQIIGCELGPNLNRFKCAPHSQLSLSGSLLKDHQSRHTTELRSFPCPRKNCQNVYTVQRKLDLHLKCDHDGLGFQCKYANCGMVFDSEHSLGKHFNMHCVKIRTRKKKKLSDIISKNVAIYSIIQKNEQAHDDSIWSCAWGRNENDGVESIVTGSVDDVVKIWKWEDNTIQPRHILEGHQLGIVSIDINTSGTLAATSSLGSQIRVWDLETGKLAKGIDANPADAWTIAFSPDSRYLATGSHTGKINLFGVDSGQKESSMDTRGKFVLSLAYSPDGKYIACGAIDGIVNIFDTTTGRSLHTLEGHAMPIRSLCFSPDSQLLVTGSDDSHIKIYDVQHANLVGTLSGHGSWVLTVDFNPDNVHFVSGSSDRKVKIWDATTRQCVHTFGEHSDQVWCAKYNPEGNKVVSVSDDKSVYIYDCPL